MGPGNVVYSVGGGRAATPLRHQTRRAGRRAPVVAERVVVPRGPPPSPRARPIFVGGGGGVGVCPVGPRVSPDVVGLGAPVPWQYLY